MDSLENARALYTFEEELGNVIRNRAASPGAQPARSADIQTLSSRVVGVPPSSKAFGYQRCHSEHHGIHTVWLLLIFVSTNHSQLFTKTRTLVRSPDWRIDEPHDRD